MLPCEIPDATPPSKNKKAEGGEESNARCNLLALRSCGSIYCTKQGTGTAIIEAKLFQQLITATNSRQPGDPCWVSKPPLFHLIFVPARSMPFSRTCFLVGFVRRRVDRLSFTSKFLPEVTLMSWKHLLVAMGNLGQNPIFIANGVAGP